MIKKKNSFSHITFVYNNKKKNKKYHFIKNKKKISFEKVLNPVEKKKFSNNFIKEHNINLYFYNRDYFIETIGYNKVSFQKKSSFNYFEKKDFIKIVSASPNFLEDINYLKEILHIKEKKNFYLINSRIKKPVRLYESKEKIYNTYLDSAGSNILSIFVNNITLVRNHFKKKNIKITKIFRLKLLKENKIFFARFPSGMLFEFLNY